MQQLGLRDLRRQPPNGRLLVHASPCSWRQPYSVLHGGDRHVHGLPEGREPQRLLRGPPWLRGLPDRSLSAPRHAGRQPYHLSAKMGAVRWQLLDWRHLL